MLSLEKKIETEGKKQRKRSKSKDQLPPASMSIPKSEYESQLKAVHKNLEQQITYLKQELMICQNKTSELKSKNRKQFEDIKQVMNDNLQVKKRTAS